MSGGILAMSVKERERAAALVRQAVRGELSQRVCAERLGIGVRQFKRLVRAWRKERDSGLVSRQRGRPSHRRMSQPARGRIEALLREKYPDFGATLAAEKLLELDDIKISIEMVRRIQIGLGLWRPKTRKARRVFQLRQRRPRFGELIQIDGSPHDWFEGRGPRCTLIVFIDDATGQLTALRFAPVESGAAYLAALRDHVLTHGRPLAFYSDRHGIFRVNAKDAASGDGKTEFGRVVERLEIGLINALTPQAKGRVERANQTLQDRLIKEMRLRNISSMQEAWRFCHHLSSPGTIGLRFRRATRGGTPASGRRPRRHWTCCWRGARSVFWSKALTFSYGGTKYCVNTGGAGTALRGVKVMVHHLADDRLHVMYKDRA